MWNLNSYCVSPRVSPIPLPPLCPSVSPPASVHPLLHQLVAKRECVQQVARSTSGGTTGTPDRKDTLAEARRDIRCVVFLQSSWVRWVFSSEIVPVFAYMLAKFTLRWKFYRTAPIICNAPHYDSVRKVVNPSKGQKLEEVASRH